MADNVMEQDLPAEDRVAQIAVIGDENTLSRMEDARLLWRRWEDILTCYNRLGIGQAGFDIIQGEPWISGK